MIARGKYIVLEGLDGSGKTTQFEKLVQRMAAVGVREPGGTKMAENIRSLIKDSNLKRDPETNIWLFMSARVELNNKIIRPALEAGKNVVSDRNWRSTQAYQSAEGVDVSQVGTLANLAMRECANPDLLIYIDVPVDVCEERMRLRNPGSKDYFDHKGPSFFTSVEAAYKANLKNDDKVTFVNGVGSADQVATRIWHIVNQRIEDVS